MRLQLLSFLTASALLAQQPDVPGSLTQAETAISAAISAAGVTGKVRYYQLANPAWDPFISSEDPVMRATIRAGLQRIATYSPFFDDKLAWMPRAHVYVDSYAIYKGDPIMILHPDWVLHDSLQRKLFIPWGCSSGTCPQFAGDISSTAFVAWRIANIKAALAPGYIGLFLDDVNLALNVSNGAGVLVAPIDRATGKAMTLAAWQNYFARYVAQVRTAFPGIEIVHNSVWFNGTPAGNPLVAAQMAQADYINVERGFGDGGVTGGTGTFSLSALMNYIDSVHAIGKAVVIEDYYMANQLYSLACYFLVQSGRDFWGDTEQLPSNWPANLYRTNLGMAKGPRYQVDGLWRRDFASGFVIVKEPGGAAQTVALPAGTVDPDNKPVTTVTLEGKQGGIYLNAAR